jgi:hypothetical protein
MLTIAAPAHADQVTLTDPGGDSHGSGLDITTVDVRNRDSAVVAVVGFRRVTRGDIIVGVRARGGAAVRIINEHRPQREDRTYVIRGSLRRGVEGDTCPAASTVWDLEARTATLRLPSRCLDGGNYGAIRAAVLTEQDAGDVDWAPERANGEIGTTAWIDRG